MADILARGMAVQAQEKAETVQQTVEALPKGLVFKGAVNYYGDLPNNADTGDTYTVLYKGTSGTTADGTEYAWGKINNVSQWIKLGAELATVATSGDYNDLINKPTIPPYTAGAGIEIENGEINIACGSGVGTNEDGELEVVPEEIDYWSLNNKPNFESGIDVNVEDNEGNLQFSTIYGGGSEFDSEATLADTLDEPQTVVNNFITVGTYTGEFEDQSTFRIDFYKYAGEESWGCGGITGAEISEDVEINGTTYAQAFELEVNEDDTAYVASNNGTNWTIILNVVGEDITAASIKLEVGTFTLIPINADYIPIDNDTLIIDNGVIKLGVASASGNSF